jgi:mono/diheme cytochrome c family protein
MKRVVKWSLLFFLAACGGGGGVKGADSDEGKQLFDETCGRCHGIDGHGVPAIKAQLGVPDMTDRDWQGKHSDEDIKRTVREGSRSKKMPMFGDRYSDAQLEKIIAHVRSFGVR